jgi:hypothetical protein
MYGISLKKVNTYVNAECTALTPFLDYEGMMFFIGIHERVRFWTEKGTLLAVVLTAFLVYHLCHIVHAMPPAKRIGVNKLTPLKDLSTWIYLNSQKSWVYPFCWSFFSLNW